MTRNVYDDPDFFAGYAQLDRSRHGLAGAAEWPVLRSLLPPLAGARVLDLGCGYGWFSRFAREQGATSVLGVDVSERMLERAASDTDDEQITYVRADLETFAPDGPFDLAFSSLTLHYLADLGPLLSRVRAALAPGARLVASVEHPVFTASPTQQFVELPTGQTVWPVSGYLDEGPRTTSWITDGVVKQHRTTAGYLTLLLDAGFAIERVVDWGPSAQEVAARRDWAHERDRPYFLLLAAGVPGTSA